MLHWNTIILGMMSFPDPKSSFQGKWNAPLILVGNDGGLVAIFTKTALLSLGKDPTLLTHVT